MSFNFFTRGYRGTNVDACKGEVTTAYISPEDNRLTRLALDIARPEITEISPEAARRSQEQNYADNRRAIDYAWREGGSILG